MEGFQIEYYDKSENEYPAKDFIESLDSKMRAKFYMLVKLLHEYGNLLREPYSKHISDGVFEIRAKQGTDTARILYFFTSGEKIILTTGFVKKTQKTPKAEINLAKKYRAAYLARKTKGE
jgi:phage-related protein